MNPRVSFVIPCHNVERWVSKAIFSCREQSIKQIEIIAVNDGSMDATDEILEWHASQDSRVKVVTLAENEGRSAARNVGNDQARSDLILVLDADDMATRNRAKDTLTIFQLKKCDVAYGSFHVIDPMGNVAPQKIMAGPFDPEMSKKRKLNFICHSTMAYRKKVAEVVRYESGDYSKLGLDDWKFQWDAWKAGFKFHAIRTPVAYYRDTESGISQNRDVKEVERVKEEFLATI